MQDPVVIVGMARTPMGGLQGSLSSLTAAQLGAAAVAAAVARAGVAGEDIDEALMGCVLPAGQGQAPARQAVLGAGLPQSAPCSTVNKMCGSGMKAAMLAHDVLLAGASRVALAGGMESMSNAPYLLAKARALFEACGLNALQGASDLRQVGMGSTIFAVKPGDGSAREQAASCQKVLGGWANMAVEYATKRYRSNLINWGMLPFIVDPSLADTLKVGDWLVVPNVRSAVQNADPSFIGYVTSEDGKAQQISLALKELTSDERKIILDGCLINFYNS